MHWLSIIIGLSTTGVLIFTIENTTSIELPWFVNMLLYLIIYTTARGISVQQQAKRAAATDNTATSTADTPISGPLGRYGPGVVTAIFELSALLSTLNPFQLTQQIQQIKGMAAVRKRYGNTIPSADTYTNRSTYTLPVVGEWHVVNGGITPETSHSWEIFNQRYAHDFLKRDADGRTHRGKGTRLTDYYCYGQPIVAAADGVVVQVRDGIRNAPFVGYYVVDFLCRDFRGNFVVIRHAEDEYGVYAHFIPGSISVTEGQEVQRGALLGRCGHSGHSSEPHLHFHLQDQADFYTGMGVPVRFTDVNIHSENVEKPTFVSGGMRVVSNVRG